MKALRANMGLTGAEFGKRLNVASTPIYEWENNIKKPSQKSWRAFLQLEQKEKDLATKNSKSVPDNYADRFKNLRGIMGLSYAKFGERLGVVGSAPFDWERGKKKPTPGSWSAFLRLEKEVGGGAEEPSLAAVKIEEEAPTEAGPSRQPIWEEHEIDQSRTEFRLRIGEMCDLTSDAARWEPVFDASSAVLVRHQMEPIPGIDDVFPLRDPTNSLGRVHPRYADDQGRCHANVQVHGAVPGDQITALRRRINAALTAGGMTQMSSQELKTALEGVCQDTQAEMARLIANTQAGSHPVGRPPRVEPRRLSRRDVQPHETALIRQYGLVALEPNNREPRPTLRNGRILGIYMGSLLETQADHERAEADHPHYGSYAIDANRSRGSGRLVTYSADGCTNSMGYANTPLQANSQRPAYDRARITAIFLPVQVTMTDNQGRQHNETVVTLVGLDNLYRDDNPSRQVLVEYGEPFLNEFAQPRRSTRMMAPPIKRDPSETTATPASPPKRSRPSSSTAPAAPGSDARGSHRSSQRRPSGATTTRPMPMIEGGWPEVYSRGWNRGDRFGIMAANGLPQYFEVTRSHTADASMQGDFIVYYRPG